MRVVGYVRLSRDEDKENYSSILSQKSIIEEYAKQHSWTVAKYYEDDNCSGYTFDRPALNELIRDMETDKFDMVIAKDLSRIGRHNAYTLLFLDKVKRLNKRLVLPKEGNGYDTIEDESDLLGITTWYNEMYVKDISRKIKGSIRAKQKEGKMIIKEVFGYQRSLDDKHRLEIDLEAAAIVQKIFKLYLSGLGYRKIAECLNQEGYPTPSQYKAYKEGAGASSIKTASSWNSLHVQRILKNDIYTGTLRLGKTEKKIIKGKSQKQPEDLQYVFTHNHPAIIGTEMFEEAQRTAEGRKTDHTRGAASLNNFFSGLMYCQDCGSYMIAYRKQGKPACYICGNYHMHGRSSCQRHGVREDVLFQALMEFLGGYTEFHKAELCKHTQNTEAAERLNHHQLLKKLIQERQNLKSRLKHLVYQKLIEQEKENHDSYQNITLESLVDLEKDLKQRIQYLDNKIMDMERECSNSQRAALPTMQEVMNGILNDRTLRKKHVSILVDKILIAGDGTPTILMNAEFEALCIHNREDVNLVLDPLICI